ncbi:MAG TPA: xanthine dehydrogenase family protein molybdopterin-binding subunit, partial [Rhodopila sp.]|nr:xanthine dehydrogenase family protein molybdopterin-binding subunit [Rhodopila sp.]
VRIDTSAATAVPGVVTVYTHENRPKVHASDEDYQDEVSPPGQPFRPLFNDRILFSGQPVALVLAEDFDTARFAASLVQVSEEPEAYSTDLRTARDQAFVPKEKRSGISPPPEPRGEADSAFGAAAVTVRNEYHLSCLHHNPMEPHATTVVWNGDGSITVYDKIQGVQNTQAYLSAVFGLKAENVHVLSPFVGGAFGSGLRPQYQAFLATMAALALRQSVRVELTRDQMFTLGFRPETINTVALGADHDGTLRSIRHDAIARTSRFEDYQEVVVNWSGLLYHCDNVHLDYRLVRLDTYTPLDMRAPGAPIGVFAIESAMDELAYALKMDPLALRLKNFAEIDENEGKPFTSRELHAAALAGAERFGWAKRSQEPRSMREGHELIGWGMAAGIWEALMTPHTVRATLNAEGKLEIACASADIGTGTYTILTQIAADALGVAMEDIATKLGDSSLPSAPVEGGSWTAASAGSSVHLACRTLRERLLMHARRMPNSPLANADLAHVVFRNGHIALRNDPSHSIAIGDVLRSAELARIEVEEAAEPDAETKKRFSQYTHAVVFVEVRVDEQLGVARLTRIVHAVAAGKIINPQTARSQVIGGTVFGIGMALEEESMLDHRLGRFMNHNLAEYHIPVNADVPDIEVIFVEEHDDKANPLGVKGVGEIGAIGTPAAIANAIYHATGRRIRDLPITIDKLAGS